MRPRVRRCWPSAPLAFSLAPGERQIQTYLRRLIGIAVQETLVSE